MDPPVYFSRYAHGRASNLLPTPRPATLLVATTGSSAGAIACPAAADTGTGVGRPALSRSRISIIRCLSAPRR